MLDEQTFCMKRLELLSFNTLFLLCSVVTVKQDSGSLRTGLPVLILTSVKVRAQVCAVSCASTLLALTDVTATQAS